MHCSVENAAVSCVNQRERLTQYRASPSEERKKEEEEEEEEEEKQFGHLLLFGWVLSRCFLVPLGVLLVIKTLD